MAPSPYVHFPLDRDGYEHCIQLLAVEGITFREEIPVTFPEHPPFIREIRGKIYSRHGENSCCVRDAAGDFEFVLRLRRSPQVIEDVERAFAGHLMDIANRAVPVAAREPAPPTAVSQPPSTEKPGFVSRGPFGRR